LVNVVDIGKSLGSYVITITLRLRQLCYHYHFTIEHFKYEQMKQYKYLIFLMT